MSGYRILVAEDNSLVLMSLEGLVEDMDWTLVGPATNLAEATECAANEDYDVALFDVNLNGEKSFPAAEIAAGKGVPILFATGYDSGLSLPDGLEDAKIVVKPFRLDDLEQQLKDAVSA